MGMRKMRALRRSELIKVIVILAENLTLKSRNDQIFRHELGTLQQENEMKPIVLDPANAVFYWFIDMQMVHRIWALQM